MRKPYPEYKDSGVEWIGKIPSHWSIKRGKFLFDSKKEINSDFQCENLLSLTLDGVLKKDMFSNEGLRPMDYKTYQVFYPDNLVFKLMIRQPDFVDKDFALQIFEQTKMKKPHNLLEKVRFEEIIEGNCIQMLHLGSYDSEPESFRLMESFAKQDNYCRISKTHREIYLSDARKVSPDKLKTVLRFSIEKR